MAEADDARRGRSLQILFKTIRSSLSATGHFRPGRKRLGHVLGWTGNVLCGLFVLLGLGGYFKIYDWIEAQVTGSTVVYDPVIIAQLSFLTKHNLASADNLEGPLRLEWLAATAGAKQSQLGTLIFWLSAGMIALLIGHAFRYIFSAGE